MHRAETIGKSNAKLEGIRAMKKICIYVAVTLSAAILACCCHESGNTPTAKNEREVIKTDVTLALEKKRLFIAVPPFDLSGGSPSGGTYEGPGVANNRFSAEKAGVGVHKIVYTYKGVSAWDSIEVFGGRRRRANPSCGICGGTGLVDCVSRIRCPNCSNGYVCVGPCLECDGTGQVRTIFKLWLGTRDCWDCDGTGKRYAQCKKCKGMATVKCPDCKGTGKAVCKCVK